jgi:hypothetical protein
MSKSRNFNYAKHHLLQVIETCRAWPSYSEANNYILKTSCVEAFEPGMTKLAGFGIDNLDHLEEAVHSAYKDY